MNEDECVRAYTGSLSKWPIVISTFFAPFKIRRIRKRNFKAETAEDFVKEFDAVRQKIRGFKRLEQQRERIMAERLIKLSQNHKSVLAIVEAQRLNGLFSALQAVQL
jgi:pheromone shutdown protein TraB